MAAEQRSRGSPQKRNTDASRERRYYSWGFLILA
jgi:hypothetical protein